MNILMTPETTAAYIRSFIPLVTQQTNLERSYAERSYVQGQISMAFFAQLIDIPTWKDLEKELLEAYKKQVDKFETNI